MQDFVQLSANTQRPFEIMSRELKSSRNMPNENTQFTAIMTSSDQIFAYFWHNWDVFNNSLSVTIFKHMKSDLRSDSDQVIAVDYKRQEISFLHYDALWYSNGSEVNIGIIVADECFDTNERFLLNFNHDKDLIMQISLPFTHKVKLQRSIESFSVCTRRLYIFAFEIYLPISSGPRARHICFLLAITISFKCIFWRLLP